MSIDNITQPREDGTSTLLCGRPDCEQVAETMVSFTWADSGWTGILGACWEHHEDLAVMTLKSRVEDDVDRDVPRD